MKNIWFDMQRTEAHFKQNICHKR